MAGHSHSSNIAHRKAAVDSKRSKMWSKLARAIIVAARMGGGDPDSNLKLRYAIADARAVSMPRENIERNIKKGTGELESEALDETIYEGYGPGGVAVMCEILTDNRNRTASDVRHTFAKNGGNLGTTGSVAYLFERKGVILVPKDSRDVDDLMELALEAGAEDVEEQENDYRVVTTPEDFTAVREALGGADIAFENAEITMEAQNSIDLDAGTARQTLRLIDALEENDDVQEVYANFDISEEVMAEVAS